MENETANPGRARIRALVLMLLVGVAVFGVYRGRVWWKDSRAQEYAAACKNAKDLRDWETLRQTAAQWNDWDPEAADALVFLAESAQQTGDFETAADSLLSVPRSNPKSVAAYLAAMKIQFGPLNRPLEGETTAKLIFEIEPRAAEAHSGLIEFYVMTLQHEKLIEQIRSAIELKCEAPSAYPYLLLADTLRVGNGPEMNETWLLSSPEEELFLVAKILHLPEPGPGSSRQDKHRLVDTLLEKFPTNTELLAYKADIAIKTGQLDEVIALLKQVKANVENDSRFWRYKGWVHLNRGELEQAESALEQAIELRPLDKDARSWLSDLLRRKGQIDEAQTQDELVRQYREIRDEINVLESMNSLPTDLLKKIQRYASESGDRLVANSLRDRILNP